ncbi:MAG: hypothetical protein IPK85_04330 [Gemmatimonadetes bacterium]|nr:hypothetical protein [Gemmatimonadota bacterium]
MARETVTYRELRNTPGRVLERLAEGEALSLVAEGEPKALLIPVIDGDLETAMDAWNRGRALLALARLQAAARVAGADELSMTEVIEEVAAVRKARRKRER